MPQAQTLPMIDPKSSSDALASVVPNTGGGGDDIQSILSSAGITDAAKRVTVPYAVSGTDIQTPKIHEPMMKAMKPEGITPHADTRYAERLAVRHNNFAQVTNALNQYANKKAADKFADNKADIATVMKAQQQIDNANLVLANDPNNAMAKQVIEQNKKIIEGKFADPKIGKMLQKAFDISFTDPEKNNTPEVKAMQEAQKEVKAATAADVDHNTPAEKKVGEIADNGGKPPEQTKSATPLADKFLGKQVASIQNNPMYQEQLKQANIMEQKISQYVIPKIMDAYTKRALAEIHEGGALRREILKSDTDMRIAQARIIARSADVDAQNRTRLSAVAMEQRGAMARTMAKIAAATNAYNDPRLKGTAIGLKLQQSAVDDISKQIGAITGDNSKLANDNDLYERQLATMKKDDPSRKLIESQLSENRHTIDLNNLAISQYTDLRAKTMSNFYGTPVGVPTGNTAGYMKDGRPANPNPSRTDTIGSEDDDSDDGEDSAINTGDYSRRDSLINLPDE